MKIKKLAIWCSVFAVLLATGGVAQAIAQEEEHVEGRIVKIGEDPAGEVQLEEQIVVEEENAAPVYWIGIAGRGVENPVLRTQLQLAKDMGVVVEQVVDDSPAAKSGVRRHDIILRANGKPVHNMGVLKEVVEASEGKPIELQLIRLSKEIELTIAPEERPQGLSPMPNNPPGVFMGEGRRDALQQFMEQFNQQRLPEGMQGFRVFGPGMVMGVPEPAWGNMPKGVGITVHKQGDEPAEVTVKRGDETWTVRGGDKEALAKLPDDIRPLVEQVLGSVEGRAGMNFDFDFKALNELPKMINPGQLEEQLRDGVVDRLEKLEKQLEEMRERLEKSESKE